MSCQLGTRAPGWGVQSHASARAVRWAPGTRSPDINGWGRRCEQPGLERRRRRQRRQPPGPGGRAPPRSVVRSSGIPSCIVAMGRSGPPSRPARLQASRATSCGGTGEFGRRTQAAGVGSRATPLLLQALKGGPELQGHLTFCPDIFVNKGRARAGTESQPELAATHCKAGRQPPCLRAVGTRGRALQNGHGGQAGTSSGRCRGPCTRPAPAANGAAPRGTSSIIRVVFAVTSPHRVLNFILLRAKGKRRHARRAQEVASEGPSLVARSRPRAPRGKMGRAPPRGPPQVGPAPCHGHSRHTRVHMRAHSHSHTRSVAPSLCRGRPGAWGWAASPSFHCVSRGLGILFAQAADAGSP